MSYTVKQLAKLSGVSSRTLRFYDEINLLKPGYYGENNYRYYDEEQLLILQQILFYRELGFPLSDIQKIINNDDFNKINALESHKNILKQDVIRKQNLIETIDKTIAHIRGNAKMKDEELYYGFDSAKQKEHEKYLIEEGIMTPEFLDECNVKINTLSDKEKNLFIHDIKRIMNALVSAIEKHQSPSSAEVQNLLQEHYIWLTRTFTPTKDSYLGLMQLYQTPAFRTFYDEQHLELLEFMINAMQIYANEKL